MKKKSPSPRTLEAKWLDPECWEGCQSLVYKHQRDEALKVCAEIAAQLAGWRGYTPDWQKLDGMIKRLTNPFQK